MSKRRGSQFTVDAESVQGIAGATVTFKALTVGTVNRYRTDDEFQDRDLLRQQVVAWSGIVDDNDNDLPDPGDEPDALDALYVHEKDALMRLLWAGPHGESAKN